MVIPLWAFHRIADEMGSRNAPFRLGYMYDTATGVKTDDIVAEKYYRSGIELNPDSATSYEQLIYSLQFLHCLYLFGNRFPCLRSQ